MKRLSWKWITLGLVGLAFVVLVGIRISSSLKKEPERQAMGPFRRGRGAETVSVRVEPAKRSTVEVLGVFSSSLQAEQEMEIMAGMAGRLAAVNVKEGQIVKRGTLLARLDDKELQLQFKQISARLQASRASLRQVESRLQRARADYDRIKQLFERKAATQQELENVRYQVENAEVDYAVAQTQLQQIEADYELMRLRLQNVNIEAPISGVITSTPPIAGGHVNTSTLIARITVLDSLEVVFNVPERDINKIKLGQKLLISTDAFPGRQFEGVVHHLEAAIDPQTRTMAVRGRVANPQLQLRPGMSARVEIVLDRKENILAVPREAIMLLAGGSYVYTVQENRAKLQKVKTGVEGRERVEIVEGLREGEMVVVVGQQDLQDGQTVVPLGAGDGEKQPREDDRPPRRPDRDSADAAITRRGGRAQ